MNTDILKLIDKNAKLTAAEIAAMLGLDVKIVEKEIAEMEDAGVISGYPTLINWQKTDVNRVTALVEVKVTPERGSGYERIAEAIYRYEEVEAVYLVSGAYDFSVLVNGKSLQEVSNFVAMKIATIDSVVSTATYFVMNKYKQHGLVTADKKEDERMLVTP